MISTGTCDDKVHKHAGRTDVGEQADQSAVCVTVEGSVSVAPTRDRHQRLFEVVTSCLRFDRQYSCLRHSCFNVYSGYQSCHP
jgi:hypothetical protein